MSLRVRLALALGGVAALAVALATVVGNLGLEPRLREAARGRLDQSAQHIAAASGGLYRRGGWGLETRASLRHVAAAADVRLAVETGDGTFFVNGRPAGATATAAVVAGGRRVGTLTVSPSTGGLLSAQERHLQHSLDRLHLYAGLAAIVAAVVAALLLAEVLARPLRRIRIAADRIERGELETRVEAGGDPEAAAVARALNRLAETLEHEEEIRKATVADLGHELRTPVNGLLARIEAAQDRVLAGPENLEAMHAEALRLTRLLDDLSALADAERPGLLLSKESLDLAAVAGTVADSFALRFQEADIDLRLELEAVYVDGDRGRLEQVTANLLSNALRYTGRGGVVSLTVGSDQRDAYLEVGDSGIGIAPDDLRHIFTRFWRSDRSRSRATGGSGIGLAVVRELVRAHDGRIEVDSAIGRGSRFRVSLPHVRPPQSHPASAVTADGETP